MRTTVFFGTNRRIEGSPHDFANYEAQFAPAAMGAGRLTCAVAAIEGADLEQRKAGTIAGIESIATGAFDPGAIGDIAGGRNLLIFLHGFANGFEAGITRAAFLRDWFAASGVPAADCAVVGFSWPSGGKVVDEMSIVPGLLTLVLTAGIAAVSGHVVSPLADAYEKDKASAIGSAQDILAFFAGLESTLRRIRKQGRKVFLLAHSMGNLALKEAVLAWKANGLPTRAVFDEIFLCASDVDAAEQDAAPVWLASLARLGGRISVYASRSDEILRLARVLNGAVRLGADGPEGRTDQDRFPRTKWRFVDCTGIPDEGPNGGIDASHQYYRRVAVVRDDIARAMDGKGAGGRSVLKP